LAAVVSAAPWAYNNPPAERDWGWHAIGETNRITMSLLEAFYNKEAEQRYFQGCSNGGRKAPIWWP